MNIIILDNNVDRHIWHKTIWTEFIGENSISIVNSMSDHKINQLCCDMFVVHLGNPESEFIQELSEVSFIRIFFSEGFTDISSYPAERQYFIPKKDLKDFFKNLLFGADKS